MPRACRLACGEFGWRSVEIPVSHAMLFAVWCCAEHSLPSTSMILCQWLFEGVRSWFARGRQRALQSHPDPRAGVLLAGIRACCGSSTSYATLDARRPARRVNGRRSWRCMILQQRRSSRRSVERGVDFDSVSRCFHPPMHQDEALQQTS